MTEKEPFGQLSGLVKAAIEFRVVLLLVALVIEHVSGVQQSVLLVMFVVAYSGVGMYMWGDTLAVNIQRRPWLFLVDIVITLSILNATDPEGPFVLYTITTGFLAGALFGAYGALAYGAGLVMGYQLLLFRTTETTSFMSLFGIPVLIMMNGYGAAVARRLIMYTGQVETDLKDTSTAAAAAEERARLAREMHDTLGKTLHGISLSATALSGWVKRDPTQAETQAKLVAKAAETAAAEARQLIGDLRSDELTLPLHRAVAAWAQEFANTNDLELGLALAPVTQVSSSARYELFTILRESLRNVVAHADATDASVYLAVDGPDIVLEVADNGVGLPTTDLEQLSNDGHYGLLGMRERARRAGGDLYFLPAPKGARVRAVIPAMSAHDMVKLASPATRPTADGEGATKEDTTMETVT